MILSHIHLSTRISRSPLHTPPFTRLTSWVEMVWLGLTLLLPLLTLHLKPIRMVHSKDFLILILLNTLYSSARPHRKSSKEHSTVLLYLLTFVSRGNQEHVHPHRHEKGQ